MAYRPIFAAACIDGVGVTAQFHLFRKLSDIGDTRNLNGCD